MPSVPSVSNFSWPYGWSSSGARAATEIARIATTLLSMSSTDSSAAPSTVSAPVRAPTPTLSAAESALSSSTIKSARRTPSDRIGAGVTIALDGRARLHRQQSRCLATRVSTDEILGAPPTRDMPELPEVEAAVDALHRHVTGRTIARLRLLHPALSRRIAPRRLRTLAGARIGASSVAASTSSSTWTTAASSSHTSA